MENANLLIRAGYLEKVFPGKSVLDIRKMLVAEIKKGRKRRGLRCRHVDRLLPFDRILKDEMVSCKEWEKDPSLFCVYQVFQVLRYKLDLDNILIDGIQRYLSDDPNRASAAYQEWTKSGIIIAGQMVVPFELKGNSFPLALEKVYKAFFMSAISLFIQECIIHELQVLQLY